MVSGLQSLAAQRAVVRVYQERSAGIVAPQLLTSVQARYTPEAMRAKVAGDIETDVTVDADGRVTDVLIKTAPEPAFGLDEETVRAISQCTFRPGTLNGQPVPVRVHVVTTMRLH